MSQTGRSRWYAAGAVMALLGAAAIAATIVWQWRHLPYGLGVAALMIGCVILVVLAIRRAVWKVIAGAAVAALIVTGGVVAITGIAPKTLSHWEEQSDDQPSVGLSGYSARTGDLLIAEGTAYNVTSGDVVWSIDGDDIDPMLVRSDIVVLSTSDEVVAVETSTGDELWRSPLSGRGIVVSGDTLVVSRYISDSETEAVALELRTGDIVWRRPGQPVMECDLGPISLYSVAREQSHVLVDHDNDGGQTELLSVADGSTTIADVDCSVTARMVGDVLLETNKKTLLARSPTDGKQLWSAPIDESWVVEGNGAEVFTTRSATYGYTTELIAIDVATGQSRAVEPPAGKVWQLSPTERIRTADVWVLVDLESGTAMWNPSTDAFVEIPDADSISDYSVDAHSGWIALSGRTRDITGDTTSQCWAFSPSGELFGPAPGTGCWVDEGVMAANDLVYPLK